MPILKCNYILNPIYNAKLNPLYSVKEDKDTICITMNSTVENIKPIYNSSLMKKKIIIDKIRITDSEYRENLIREKILVPAPHGYADQYSEL